MNLPGRLIYEFGQFRLDAQEHVLLRDGEVIPLAPKAIDLLVALVENSGHVISKDELIKQVWPDSFVEEANLSHQIFTLRKALNEDKNDAKYIETVPRRGYRFVATVTEIGYSSSDLVVTELNHSRIVIEEEQQLNAVGQSVQVEHRTVPKASGRKELAENKPRRKTTAVSLIAVGALVALSVGVYSWVAWKPKPEGSNPAAKTLAVLPFKPIVADKRDEALELGMADTLINKLSSIRQLIVRPINAVRNYSSLEQDPIAAGHDLGVDYVLEGNLQMIGDKTRATVRLLSVKDGRAIWTDKCDQVCSTIFALQDAVAEQIAATLVLELAADEGDRLAKHYTESREAYQLYVKGLYFWNKFEADDLKKALTFFQQATEKDPNYALAYTGMAHTYNVLGLNFLSPGEAFPQAKIAATRALALDPTLAEAHAALGAIHLFYEFNWLSAESELRLAIDLNPNYPTARELYAYYLVAMGRIEESIEQKKRAQELDPLSIIISDDMAAGFYYARHYDQAIEQIRKTIELDPNFAGGHFWLGLIYAQKGMAQEAIAEANQAIASSGESQNIAMLGQVYALAGRKKEAQDVITDLTQQSKRRYVSSSDIARIYAALGDKEESFSWLAKAYEERAGWLIYLNVEPIFDGLRSDKRFTDLLRRLKFPQ